MDNDRPGRPRRTSATVSCRWARWVALMSGAGLALVSCATNANTATTGTAGTAGTTPVASVATSTPVGSARPASDTGPITNTWTGAVVDPTRLPIGDSFVSTSGASAGRLWACRSGNPNAGGAHADGPWLNTAAGTWDSTKKLTVQGSVTWEAAKYSETVADGKRVLVTNNVPVADPTGTFPIASADPSYQYDRNPGTITAKSQTVTLPQLGTKSASPTCMSEGPVGMFRNGVLAFNSLDGRGHDAVAHESQDLCNGHPAMTTYHYHNVASCLRDKATASSTVVGFAFD